MLQKNRSFHPFLLAALLCGASAVSLFAQGPGGPPPGDGPGRHHGPPPNPLFEALDTNHDGVISAEEMANASASLKSLLKNGATQLTREDLRPARPEGKPPGDREAAGDNENPHPRPPRVREHQPPSPPEDQAAPDGHDRPDPARDEHFEHRGPRGEGPEGRAHHGPPPSPLFDALDTNHDGVISAEEMDAASTTLKGLLKNGATQLRREDLRPEHPPTRQDRQEN